MRELDETRCSSEAVNRDILIFSTKDHRDPWFGDLVDSPTLFSGTPNSELHELRKLIGRPRTQKTDLVH